MSLPEPLPAAAAEVLEAIVSSPSQTLIATDFDGTLAPIVDDPEQDRSTGTYGSALGPLSGGGRLALVGRFRPIRRRALERG